MMIRGGGIIKGGYCDSHGDHRLAMTLGIASLVSQGELIIHNAESVTVSYPGFWDEIERIAG
jgi:3-phosphoshikimate 1-carboxyvinyltransferase